MVVASNGVLNPTRNKNLDVRILLDSVWKDPDEANPVAISYIKNISVQENLSNLKAKLIDLEGLNLAQLHNKGVIVDGHKVLVSSINWGGHGSAALDNRELGVIIDNADVGGYYTEVFLHDWEGGLPPSDGDDDPVKTKEKEEKTKIYGIVLGVIIGIIAVAIIANLIIQHKKEKEGRPPALTAEKGEGGGAELLQPQPSQPSQPPQTAPPPPTAAPPHSPGMQPPPVDGKPGELPTATPVPADTLIQKPTTTTGMGMEALPPAATPVPLPPIPAKSAELVTVQKPDKNKSEADKEIDDLFKL